jgi:hypothetical protein
MSFSISGFSRRGQDPLLAAWLAGGAAADRYTQSKINDALNYARANGLIYDPAAGAGLVRLNLFAGTALADALICQISELGVSATDTTSTFVAGDFVNKGSSGGITSLLAASKQITTTLTPALMNSATGAIGAYICNDWNIPAPAGTWFAPIGAGSGATVNLVRLGDTNKLQGFWGTGAAGQIVPSGTDVGPCLMTAVGTGADTLVYENGSAAAAVVASANSQRTEAFKVFAHNEAGAAQWFMDANATTRMGGYYAWKGPISAAQVLLVATMFDVFQFEMGRTIARQIV